MDLGDFLAFCLEEVTQPGDQPREAFHRELTE